MVETKSSLTTSRMRALNAVLEEGSYSAAARQLGLTQPAVSQSIQDLEKAYNVQLFEKRGRHLIPTKFCLELAPVVDQIIRLEETAEVMFKRGEAVEKGVLRISFGNLMPGLQLISKFQKKYPKIQVQAEYAIASDAIDTVMESRADIGILPNVPNDGRFRTKICLTQTLVALIPLGHPLASQEQISLRDLMYEKLIFQKKGSATQRVVDDGFRDLGLKPTASLVLEKGSEVYEAVASGLGVGFLWEKGTSRKDGARRKPITEITSTYNEMVFAKSDNKSALVDLFFSAVD